MAKEKSSRKRSAKEFNINNLKGEIVKDKNNLYLPKSAFLAEIMKCRKTGKVSDNLGIMFTALARKMSNIYVYKYPEDKEDCIQRAVLDCVLYWDRFDPTKSKYPNPFSYFSQICGNALIKGWIALGYDGKSEEHGLPFSKRIYLSDNIYSI